MSDKLLILWLYKPLKYYGKMETFIRSRFKLHIEKQFVSSSMLADSELEYTFTHFSSLILQIVSQIGHENLTITNCNSDVIILFI